MSLTAFTAGAVEFPLASGDETSLEAADPALFHLLAFARWIIEQYIGPRLVREAAECGAQNLKVPVASTMSVNPGKYLKSQQFDFPLLSVHRRSALYGDRTVVRQFETGKFEISYVLPPLTAGQATRLVPFLNATQKAIRWLFEQGEDEDFRPPGANPGDRGDRVWGALRGSLEGLRFVRATWGTYPGMGDLELETLVIELDASEQSSIGDAKLPLFEGANLSTDLAAPVGQPVADAVQVATDVGPTLAAVSPSTGTGAGGTTVTLTGTRFHPSATVFFGGVQASRVVVAPDRLSLTCRTPAHPAYPAFVVSVEVENPDGQTANLADAFTFTTP